MEEDYLEYDEIQPFQTFLEELEFSRHQIDIFSSEISPCENIIYP